MHRLLSERSLRVWKTIKSANLSAHHDTNRTKTCLRQNLESSDTALLVFGNGDGGGGPLAKMLESASRYLTLIKFVSLIASRIAASPHSGRGEHPQGAARR
jgi:hypothetical protein